MAAPTVVAAPASDTASRARRRFFRRRSTTTRAKRSPNTPRRPEAATKPGNERSNRIVRGFFTARAYRDGGSVWEGRGRVGVGNPCPLAGPSLRVPHARQPSTSFPRACSCTSARPRLIRRRRSRPTASVVRTTYPCSTDERAMRRRAGAGSPSAARPVGHAFRALHADASLSHPHEPA